MAAAFVRLRRMELYQRVTRPYRHLRHPLDPFEKYDNAEFLRRFRFSKPNFVQLEQLVFSNSERTSGRGPWIPLRIKLLITLRFYATNSFLLVCADVVDVSHSLVSHTIKTISRMIASKRRDFIKMPNSQDLVEYQRRFHAMYGFPKVIGVIDCTHIPISSPGGANAERFRCRKNFFSINTQVICDPEEKISNIVARWPGSTHDSRIFDNSSICAKLESHEFNGLLIGDQGYPCKSYLMTPLRNPQTRPEQRYNQSLSKTRVIVERVFGQWKRRFPVLSKGLRVKMETALSIIVATAVLFNITKDVNDVLLEDQIMDDEASEVSTIEIHSGNAMGNAVRRDIVNRYFS